MDKQVKAHYLNDNRWTRFAQRNEQRRATRYPARSRRCWLHWKDGQFVRREAALIQDFSLVGARLLVDRRIPKGLDLWLSLNVPVDLGSIPVQVIASKKSIFGPVHVRVAFDHPSSYDLFKAVVYGFESLDSFREQRQPHFQSQSNGDDRLDEPGNGTETTSQYDRGSASNSDPEASTEGPGE